MISMEKFTLKNLRKAFPKYNITTNDQQTKVLINGEDMPKFTIQSYFDKMKDVHDNRKMVCEFLIANDFKLYDEDHFVNYRFFVFISFTGFSLFNRKLKLNTYFNSSDLLDYLKIELDVDGRNKVAIADS